MATSAASGNVSEFPSVVLIIIPLQNCVGVYVGFSVSIIERLPFAITYPFDINGP